MFFEMPQLFDAMFSFSAVLRWVCQAVGVHSTPKNHIFIVQKFRNKVYDLITLQPYNLTTSQPHNLTTYLIRFP